MTLIYRENRGRRLVLVEARAEKNVQGETIATEFIATCYINNVRVSGYSNYKIYRIMEFTNEFLSAASWRDLFTRQPVRRFGRY